MATKKVRLSDQIRKAVDASGMSRYRICKEIGLDQPTLSRFMHGTSGLAIPTVDRLADLLGMDITVRTRAKSRHTTPEDKVTK